MAGKMKNRKDGKCFVRRAPSGGVYLICHNKAELARQKKQTEANKKKAKKAADAYKKKMKAIAEERKKKGLPPLKPPKKKPKKGKGKK
jgi:hypothetical protein